MDPAPHENAESFPVFHFAIPKDTPIPHRRKCSSILLEFPWQTQELINLPRSLMLPDHNSRPHTYHRFACALQSFEETLLNFDRSSREILLKHQLSLLGLDAATDDHSVPPSYSLVAQHPTTLSIPDYLNICDVVTAYRLREVIGLRSGIDSPIPDGSPSPCMFLSPSSSKNDVLPHYSKLVDWRKLLRDFCDIVSFSTATPLPLQPSRIPLRSLLNMLQLNGASSKYIAIAENLLYVAFELCAMRFIPAKPGELPLLPLTCPPCPPSATDFVEHTAFAEEYDAFMARFKRDRFAAKAPYRFRNGIQLAAIISPAMLIIPYRLSEKTFPRRTVLDTGARIGHRRDAGARQAENAIWDSVFKISDGGIHIDQVLQDLAVVFGDILRNDSNERGLSCYQLPMKLPYRPSLTSTSSLALGLRPRNLSVPPAIPVLPSATFATHMPHVFGIPAHPDMYQLPLFATNSSGPLSSTQGYSPAVVDAVLSAFRRDDFNRSQIGGALCAHPNVPRIEGSLSTPITPADVSMSPVQGSTMMMAGNMARPDQSLRSGHPLLTPSSMDVDPSPFLTDLLFFTPEDMFPGTLSGACAFGSPAISVFDDTDRREFVSSTSSILPEESLAFRPPDGDVNVDGLDAFTDMSHGSSPLPGAIGVYPYAYAAGHMDSSSGEEEPEKATGDAAPFHVMPSHIGNNISGEKVEASGDDDGEPDDGDGDSRPRFEKERSVDTERDVEEKDASASTNSAHSVRSDVPIGVMDDEGESELSDQDAMGDYDSDAGAEGRPDAGNGAASAPGRTKRRAASYKTPALVVSESSETSSDSESDDGSKAGVLAVYEDPRRTPGVKRKRSPSSTPLFLGSSYLRLAKSGSAEDPIDVDSLSSIFEPLSVDEYMPQEDISLSKDCIKRIGSQRGFLLYSAFGSVITIFPSFHWQLYHVRLGQFMRRIERFYVDKLPVHISRPDISIIARYTYQNWTAFTEQEKQAAISTRNVIVTGWPIGENIAFDEAGLRKVAGTKGRQISIQDYSVTPEGDFCTGVTVSGRVGDLWENRGPNGKILNALDFPMFGGGVDPLEYTTDAHAWDVTRGHHNIPQGPAYPFTHMRWSLVGLQNAITFLHLDCEGMSTDIHLLCGGKYWVFLRERQRNPLSSPAFFLDKGFHLERVLESTDYDFEGVALQPGDRLFMLPNQPHLVYTYEDSICRGGHFYFTKNMQQTLYSLMHTFVLHQFLTNTTHPSHILFRRIVIMFHMGFLEDQFAPSDPAYSHLPDVATIDGLMNLICACVLVVLGNVLEFRTYRAPTQQTKAGSAIHRSLISCDINTIPINERIAMCYARGIAMRLMEWIRICAVVTGPDGLTVSDLPGLYLFQVTETLSAYKAKADATGEHLQDSIFTRHLMGTQIRNISDHCPSFSRLAQKRDTLPESFALENKDKYKVKWAPRAKEWKGGDQNFLIAGITRLDDMCFQAQSDRCALETELLLPEFKNILLDGSGRYKRRKTA